MTEFAFDLPVYAAYLAPRGHTIRVVHTPDLQFALWVEFPYLSMGNSCRHSQLSKHTTRVKALEQFRVLLEADYPVVCG